MKNFLIIAGAIALIGALIFIIPLAINGWDFSKVIKTKVETITHDVDEAYTGIRIASDTADIILEATDGGGTAVITLDSKLMYHEVKVVDGTLTIEIKDERKWYQTLFNFSSTSITVKLPMGEYEALVITEDTGDITIAEGIAFSSSDLKLSTGDVYYKANTSGDVCIEMSTGDITVENATVGSLKLKATTGDVKITNVTSEGGATVNLSTGNITVESSSLGSFATTATTGDLTVSGGEVKGDISIIRSTGDTALTNLRAATLTLISDTGDVTFDNFDTTGNITVTTDTGDVKGTLGSEKIFIPRSDTGKIETPETTTGSVCKITTDTGDIIISIA
jgi:DUF4097 and DUF4098 domain-containing protein YvlB